MFRAIELRLNNCDSFSSVFQSMEIESCNPSFRRNISYMIQCFRIKLENFYLNMMTTFEFVKRLMRNIDPDTSFPLAIIYISSDRESSYSSVLSTYYLIRWRIKRQKVWRFSIGMVIFEVLLQLENKKPECCFIRLDYYAFNILHLDSIA